MAQDKPKVATRWPRVAPRLVQEGPGSGRDGPRGQTRSLQRSSCMERGQRVQTVSSHTCLFISHMN
eukprot:12402652-Karenia_brevis.AAC.1